MRPYKRERWLAIIIVHAAVHATNDPGVIMHASSASGAGHWISALIFFAFDIGTPFFSLANRDWFAQTRKVSGCKDYRTRYAMYLC
jgi:hypothetical protein